jgi:NAD(P)-dependent dehydrogenase (short-subunit alcohol dehydrogenase family)
LAAAGGVGVLIVTGGSRGIGAAVAELAGRRGYAVAVNYIRDERAANDVVRTLERLDAPARAIQGDVSQEAEVQHLFAETIRAFGP